MDNFDLRKFLAENKLKNEQADRVNRHIKAIQIQLDQLGVKYEMSGNPSRPFKAIYKPINKDDKWYDNFEDIVFRYNLGGVVKPSVNESPDELGNVKTWKTNPKLDSDLGQAMNNSDLSRKQRKVLQAILAGYRNGDWGRDRSTHKEVQSAYDLTNRVIQAYRDGELDRGETYASFEDIINGHLPGVEAMFEEVAEGSSYLPISGESEYELGQMVTVNTKPLLDLGYEFPDGDEGEIVDIDTADYASDDLVITVKINHIDAQGDQGDELIIDDWDLLD